MRDRAKRRKFKRDYKPTFRLSKASLVVVCAGLLLSMSLFYLAQSNQMATSGYDISSLEASLDELSAKNEQLQIQASSLQSIQQISAGVETSGMVNVEKINYVAGGTSVALNVK